MSFLEDFKKVERLTALYRELDYYCEQAVLVKQEIRSLAANMSVFDIKYAIKESEK